MFIWKMKEKQNRRWGLMILSLLCGFLVWLGAVNIADPVITDTVEVPIEIINDEVLTENGLAEGTESAYGLFITTVDGETADESLQQWWCITREGEMLSTGADQTPIAHGEQYELTLTEGY